MKRLRAPTLALFRSAYSGGLGGCTASVVEVLAQLVGALEGSEDQGGPWVPRPGASLQPFQNEIAESRVGHFAPPPRS